MSDTIIEVSDVSVDYLSPVNLLQKTSLSKKPALKNINLTFKKGDRIGLIGRNGAGKSTFLKLLANCLQPTSGNLTVNGKVASILDIGGGLKTGLTGWQNARLKYLLSSSNMDWKSFQKHVAEVSDLEEKLDELVGSYSSGMKARLSRSFLALTNGNIYLFDEYISVLDAQHERKDTFGIHNTADVIIIASHSEKILREWCSGVIWFENGKIVKKGLIDEVLPLYQQSNSSSPK